jgi:hypothetical protein
MRPMTSFNMLSRVLLIGGLISSCLLMGCESNFNHFEKFYKPAATREGASTVTAQPRASPPQLVYSHDPDWDGRLLRQDGYVLIGTTSFNGAPDLSYADRAVVAQGQKVGAAIVLLKARSYGTLTSCCSLDESLEVTSEGGASYFASYWAKSDAAKTLEPQ